MGLKYQFKPYKVEDFERVRNFLVSSFKNFNCPRNWLIDRWNFTFSVSRIFHDLSMDEWAKAIGLWEDGNGDIAVMVNEEDGTGNVFFQIAHPDILNRNLVEEMFAFAEQNCLRANRKKPEERILRLHIPDTEKELIIRAEERGYRRSQYTENWTMKKLTGKEIVVLPHGYSLCDGRETTPFTMADAHARAFGHWEDTEFIHDHCERGFAMLRTMPDYRPELDISIIGPGRNIDSFCGIWVDGFNEISILEPVGTSHDCRRIGLARAAVNEACNRAFHKGTRRVYVGSNMKFYRALGFAPVMSYIKMIFSKPSLASIEKQ